MLSAKYYFLKFFLYNDSVNLNRAPWRLVVMAKDIHQHFASMDINQDGFISFYEYHYMHIPIIRYHRYDEHNSKDDTYSLLVFLVNLI